MIFWQFFDFLAIFLGYLKRIFEKYFQMLFFSNYFKDISSDFWQFWAIFETCWRSFWGNLREFLRTFSSDSLAIFSKYLKVIFEWIFGFLKNFFEEILVISFVDFIRIFEAFEEIVEAFFGNILKWFLGSYFSEYHEENFNKTSRSLWGLFEDVFNFLCWNFGGLFSVLKIFL